MADMAKVAIMSPTTPWSMLSVSVRYRGNVGHERVKCRRNEHVRRVNGYELSRPQLFVHPSAPVSLIEQVSLKHITAQKYALGNPWDESAGRLTGVS